MKIGDRVKINKNSLAHSMMNGEYWKACAPGVSDNQIYIVKKVKRIVEGFDFFYVYLEGVQGGFDIGLFEKIGTVGFIIE